MGKRIFAGSRDSVRYRFLLVVGSVLLTICAMFAWYIAREYRLVQSTAEKRSASYASALKEHAERVIAQADSCLRDLEDDITDNGGIAFSQSERFYRKLSLAVKGGPQFSSAYVVDRNGMIIAHSQQFRMPPVDVSDRDYFIYHRTTPSSNLYISKPFTSRVSGTARFSLSRPLRDSHGTLIGLVALTYETSYFERFYTSIDVGQRGRVILATTAGDVLAYEPHHTGSFSGTLAASPLFATHLPARAKASLQMRAPISGDMSILSYQRLDAYPLVAVVSFSKTEAVYPWRVALYQQSLLLIMLMAMVAFLSYLFLRQLRTLEEARNQLESQKDDLQLKAELLDSASDAILMMDETGRLLYFNHALCSISGRSKGELESTLIQDIEPPEHAAQVLDNIRGLIASGSDAVFESAYLGASGETIPIEVHARPVSIGGAARVLSVVHDIRDRHETERRMAAIVREWQETFDAVEDAIWLLDLDRSVVKANRATETKFGIPLRQVVGKRCCDVMHVDSTPHDACPFDEMLKSGRRATTQLRMGMRWYEVTLDPVFDEHGAITKAVHVLKDISGLKQSELREHIRSEILERIARGERLSDLLGFIARSIEQERPGALCSILLASKDNKRLLIGAAPSLPDAYNIAVHRTRIGEGIGSCGTAAYRRERVVVEDIATHPFWKGFTAAEEAGLRSCWSEPILSSAGTLLGTFAIYHREPAAPGPAEIRLIEQASAFAGIAIERSRNEEERAELEEQLHQSQKMEAIGHLAGGMAHDFNNLLTPIVIYADMLKKTVPLDDSKGRSKLEAIISASHKARDLTQQLLSFGRKQVMQMKITDLNELISAFITMVRRTLRESIEITLRLSPQQQIITADRSKLEQILLNLALNAQDAIADTGSITIETGQILIDDEYARLHPDLIPGTYVMLQFADSGCGMPETVLKHVFEPFFTTKQAGHGTGLGLANVYGIVKQHNGHVEVQSTVDKGTSFRFYFPAAEGVPEAAANQHQGDQCALAGKGTVLLVEDNDMVREMALELLEELGYTVLAEGHPEQALEMACRNETAIDLVITDVVMPGMDGKRFFEQLREQRPEIGKVLYMSGYNNAIMTPGGILQDGVHFLQKPFTIDAFQAKVLEILEG